MNPRKHWRLFNNVDQAVVSEVMFSLNAAISSSVHATIQTAASSAAKLGFAAFSSFASVISCPSYDLDAFWCSQAQATS